MQKTVPDDLGRSVLADMVKSGPDQNQGQVDIQLYRSEIPAFAAQAMDRLYGALYSSSAYLRASGAGEGISTYVARQEGAIRAVFLYVVENGRARVVNEGMHLAADDICRFAGHLFRQHADVGAIDFVAVQSNGGAIPYLHQRFFFAEDIIAPLPASVDEYAARLGSATRKNIRRHRNRIERDFPGFRHRLVEGRDADEQHLRAIIEMNRVRMERKHKTSFIDEQVTQEIIRLVRECGEVCIATIDGRLCAGTIIFRVGDSHISKVHAHDPAYDDYRMGMVCIFLSVCACIERGGSQFHFGHGRYEYKSALLGEYHGFDRLTLYRSPWAMLRHAHTALKIAAAGYRMEASHWLVRGTERADSVAWRAAARGLAAWRAFKQRSAG